MTKTCYAVEFTNTDTRSIVEQWHRLVFTYDNEQSARDYIKRRPAGVGGIIYRVVQIDTTETVIPYRNPYSK